jgi:hypothetical protein
MSEAASRYRKLVVERVLHGRGETTGDARRAAFDNRDVAEPARALVDKVAHTAWKVTDEDVASVRAQLTDDAIFELAVAAAVGQSARQLDAALAALAAATKDKAS